MAVKSYYSKPMVVTRLTGIPYRQNHMTLTTNGRMLIRSEAVHQLGLTEDDFCLLRALSGGRLLMEVTRDTEHALSQHVRKVDDQDNMQFYHRQMARQWCRMLHVKQLRLRITSVTQLNAKVRLVELERVQDMCEMYHWDDRSKGK